MKKKLIILTLLLPCFLIGCGSQQTESSIISSSTSENTSAATSSESSTKSSSSSSKSSSSSSRSSSSEEEDTSYEPAPVIPNYVLHGVFNGSFEWTDKQMVRNTSSSSSAEYMILGVELYANDVFKIHLDGDNWYGYSSIKRNAGIPSGLVTQGPTDDNIKVLTTGTYDIYCDKYSSDGNIYLAIKDDGGDDPEPTPGTVSVTGVSLSHSGKLLQHRDETFQLTASVYPNNASNKEVTWSSSDTSIAEVTSGGRIKAKDKDGVATITVKTVDGNKKAECLIYVKANGRPDYYLSGTINGRVVSAGPNNAGTYTYPAIPLSTNHYLIPDVTLVSGDKLNVRANVGNITPLKDRYNQTYEYRVTKAMSVNIYLTSDPLSCNYNYLNLVEK